MMRVFVRLDCKCVFHSTLHVHVCELRVRTGQGKSWKTGISGKTIFVTG